MINTDPLKHPNIYVAACIFKKWIGPYSGTIARTLILIIACIVLVESIADIDLETITPIERNLYVIGLANALIALMAYGRR